MVISIFYIIYMQTSMLKMPMRTTCVEDELEGRFPVFRGWDDLEASYHRAMDDYKNGRCEPADEALEEIRKIFNL